MISLTTAFVFFFVAMLAMNFILEDISVSRSVTGLDCSNNSISDGAKVTCLGIDFLAPYLLIIILSAVVWRITENLT